MGDARQRSAIDALTNEDCSRIDAATHRYQFDKTDLGLATANQKLVMFFVGQQNIGHQQVNPQQGNAQHRSHPYITPQATNPQHHSHQYIIPQPISHQQGNPQQGNPQQGNRQQTTGPEDCEKGSNE